MQTNDHSVNQGLLDYYRCPEASIGFTLQSAESEAEDSGYFGFGPGVVCYGKSKSGIRDSPRDSLSDAMSSVAWNGNNYSLPFNPTAIADNLRYERYISEPGEVGARSLVRRAYYWLRPFFPVSVRRHLQRKWLQNWRTITFPQWPVDRTVDQMFERLLGLALRSNHEATIPFIWFWPEGHSSCAIMTHDVETGEGLKSVPDLMDINDSYGIKSSFQIIPGARYEASPETLSEIRRRGFEINVHDFKHDGHLYDDRKKFEHLAEKINESAVRFQARGFRAGVLYRRQDWYPALNVSYDMSVPNVGHLDPQKGGCCTVMPYFIGDILEIPVTTTQDYSLFHILDSYSLDLWKAQVECIRSQNGLISMIVHPDYLDNTRAMNLYVELLKMLSGLRAGNRLWIALPAEVDTWWRQRHKMRLVSGETGWRIEGEGSDRARIAFAILKDGQVVYQIPEHLDGEGAAAHPEACTQPSSEERVNRVKCSIMKEI